MDGVEKRAGGAVEARERWESDLKRWVDGASAASTRKAYRTDWDRYSSWCRRQGIEALPAQPQTVALYVAHLGGELGRKVSTITRALAVISKAHQALELKSPTGHPIIREALSGLRRERGRDKKQARPLLLGELRRMLAALPGSRLLELRDRALLSVGWVGGYRRSELLGMQVEDLEWSELGATCRVPRSKTNPEGRKNETKVIPYAASGSGGTVSPASELKGWLLRSGVREGFVFRGLTKGGVVLSGQMSHRMVGTILRRTAKKAGLSAEGLSAHSLRAGLVTEAEENGVPRSAVIGQTFWASEQMFAQYSRPDHSARFRQLGLLMLS